MIHHLQKYTMIHVCSPLSVLQEGVTAFDVAETYGHQTVMEEFEKHSPAAATEAVSEEPQPTAAATARPVPSSSSSSQPAPTDPSTGAQRPTSPASSSAPPPPPPPADDTQRTVSLTSECVCVCVDHCTYVTSVC